LGFGSVSVPFRGIKNRKDKIFYLGEDKKGVSVPFRGIKNRKELKRDKERTLRKVSVPFRGIKNRKGKEILKDRVGYWPFQSPFGELKIGKLQCQYRKR